MALFRKKDKILDLTKKRESSDIIDVSSDNKSSSQGTSAFGFLSGLASSGSASRSQETDSEYVDVSGSAHDRRKKLTKRLLDMTNKLEELSNQIYHLEQRIEVLERKSGVGSY